MFYNMMSLLFVTVMTIGSEHIYMNFCLKNAVHQAVLLGDLPTPTVFWLSFQRLRMTCTGLGVVCNLIQEFDGFLERGWLATFQLASPSLASGA